MARHSKIAKFILILALCLVQGCRQSTIVEMYGYMRRGAYTPDGGTRELIFQASDGRDYYITDGKQIRDFERYVNKDIEVKAKLVERGGVMRIYLLHARVVK